MVLCFFLTLLIGVAATWRQIEKKASEWQKLHLSQDHLKRLNSQLHVTPDLKYKFQLQQSWTYTHHRPLGTISSRESEALLCIIIAGLLFKNANSWASVSKILIRSVLVGTQKYAFVIRLPGICLFKRVSQRVGCVLWESLSSKNHKCPKLL
jgi:hypothetical protein